ncbi:hypothetical protein MHH84_11045 [Bacillus sp. FSL K6-1109]|uniref:hypothetical protein n=1 Tax=Bacillus TaxID=1386 RepID=UPI0005588D06|nr:MULTISPECIES: hypothetical protein [Bacillus]MDE1398272.1 hypothetical protein [Bacillus licheniformis]MED1659455.1 hypothetical protein [Bacillus licheniformis]MED4372566.1 hypothetical protein [Bacillus licheniformis]PAC91433.1 hypothetical protein CHH99_16885 [Bacillus licheniformis]PAV33776.1 hypothetical protein CJD29_20985 [Bacillus licheniformis]
MNLHNYLFQVTREQIKSILLSPESCNMVKEWGNQEQVLDELTEGYFKFKKEHHGNINEYISWRVEPPYFH